MATKANITIDQGTSFSTSVALKSIDGASINLAGYTARAQIRKHYASSNAVSFATDLTTPGAVTISLTANQTSSMMPGRYVYDVELTNAQNVVSRLVEGIVTVNPRVTR